MIEADEVEYNRIRGVAVSRCTYQGAEIPTR